MPNARPLITLTTDFGLADAYVACMKAAILRQCPEAALIDVTHQVRPQDVLGASIALERAVAGFPAETVHLAVVDPGVGTRRRILLARARQQWIVCPDNGLITWTYRRLGPVKLYKLTWWPRRASAVFHGRDVMGPVAAMLAAGRPVVEIAQLADDPALLKIAPARAPGRRGRIIHIDHFGNATTNIAREALRQPARRRVRLAAAAIGPVRRTYSDAAPGKPLALFGSAGLLEIAVRDGSAARELNLHVGDAVFVD